MGSDVDRAPRAAWAWGRLVACALARGYHAFLLTLLVAALLPALWSWTSYVVRTGSMEPVIAPGDVVVGMPFASDEEVPMGRVVVFRNPAKPDGHELLVHRVVGDAGKGEFTTAGDANASNDVEPITADDIVSRARILVPLVGRPLLWFERGDVAPITGLMVVTILAAAAAVRPRQGPGGPHAGRGGGQAAAGQRRGLRRRTSVAAPALTMLVVGLLAVTGSQTASAAFTSSTASGSNTWAVGSWPTTPYTNTVLEDRPHVYYQVEEAAGATAAADDSGNNLTGTYSSIAAYRQAGALPSQAGYAVRSDGTSDRLVGGGAAVANPRTFTLELWFKTATTQGGKLIGFESTRNATSPSYDRHLFMRPDGRLVYGGWAATSVRTIVSPQAYNNGGWHHVVLTARPASGQEQAAVMYVDGQVVASGTTTRTTTYNGWWRVGYGSLAWLGTTYPASANFSGSIDQVAVYHTELSASRVAAHWAAR